MTSKEKQNYFLILIIAIVLSAMVGGLAGFAAAEATARSQPFLNRLGNLLSNNIPLPALNGTAEERIVTVVERASPAVVSIIVTKDLPRVDEDDFFRQFFGEAPSAETERREIGGGTGFIVSADGFIATNRHVVADPEAQYSVLLNNGERYEAQVLARDPSNDLAVLKIEGRDFPAVRLGSSAEIAVGQTVIAIGNALGEFRNTVSTGVISGLARSITASSGRFSSERLFGLIQTDASINPGNSGGPLLDNQGEVIGINVAIAQNAQNIGFAIPIDQVKQTIDNVRANGRLIRAWLGVRYVAVDAALAKANNLPRDYGALVVAGDNENEPAVLPDSPAAKAGLEENDLILEANGEKITENSPLSFLISRSKPGDRLVMRVLRNNEEIELTAMLEEAK